MSRVSLAIVCLLLAVHGHAAGPVVHVNCPSSGASCGAALQAAIDRAPAGATITLDPGKVYEGALVVRPRSGAAAGNRLTITTRGWTDKGAAWDGMVTPADRPRLAALRGAPGSRATIEIPDDAGSGHVTLVGLAFEATPPSGQGDMIRIGSATAQAATALPRDVAIRQVLLQGSRDYGQKRGIAANGRDITIDQIWCEEIFTPGQDSQCVAAWSGGQRVSIRHSYLAAGAENVLVGGAPIDAADLQPEDWLIEDVILHKPLRWREDGRNRQVKNLLEFKHGRRLTARRVLAVNNWRAAQSGRALLLNYTTNGTCPACGNLEDILIEDLVMLNVESGVSFQGYSWQPDSRNDGKLLRVTLRNVYMHLSGDGQVFQVSNVRDRHDIRVERSTFINSGESWLYGDYGRAWRDDETIGPGGPMKGLWLLDNVITNNGRYGITAPEGQHYGSGIGTFVDEDLQVAGNVIGDAPGAHLAHYDQRSGKERRNASAGRERLLKALPVDACGQWAEGKGADCARLRPVFAWRRLLPEP